jgi:hypothetical protein
MAEKLPFIPETRAQALSILRMVGDDPDQLTEPQRQAIRRLYFLDDDRSVEQLVHDGEIRT